MLGLWDTRIMVNSIVVNPIEQKRLLCIITYVLYNVTTEESLLLALTQLATLL